MCILVRGNRSEIVMCFIEKNNSGDGGENVGDRGCYYSRLLWGGDV